MVLILVGIFHFPNSSINMSQKSGIFQSSQERAMLLDVPAKMLHTPLALT